MGSRAWAADQSGQKKARLLRPVDDTGLRSKQMNCSTVDIFSHTLNTRQPGIRHFPCCPPAHPAGAGSKTQRPQIGTTYSQYYYPYSGEDWSARRVA